MSKKLSVAVTLVLSIIIGASAARAAEIKLLTTGAFKPEVLAASHSARLAGNAIKEGDWLSIDGETGAIYLGQSKVAIDRPDAELAEIERWQTKSLEHS